MYVLRLIRRPAFALFFALPCLFGISQWSTRAQAAELPMISEAEYKAMAPVERKEYEQKLKEQIEQMSPNEQEAYMQGMVETLFESLTPEQQKEVLEEAARIEAMSPEEQKAYYKQVERELEDMFAKQEKPVAEKKPEPKPELKPEPKVKKTEVVPVKISAQEKAIKEAVNLINEIMQAIDDLIVKIEQKEDFLLKVDKWGKKKKIEPWDGGFNWAKLKEKIDTLRALLDKLKDRDPKTKKHKYLSSFIENEKLYAAVYNLSVDLADHEPSVRSGKGKLLSRKVRRRSHKALRALIDTFAELLFPKKGKEDLIVSLNKLFALYAPEAKKITEEEKRARQLALAESKRPVHPSRVRTAGRAPGYEPSGPGFYEDFDFPGEYPPGYAPPSAADGERRRETKPKGVPDKAKTPAPDKKPKKPKKEEKKKAELQKDERLNKFLKRFDLNIEEIFNTILDNPNMENLDSYFTTNVIDTKLPQKVHNLNNLIRKATGGLERMKSRIGALASDSQKSYKKDIKGLVKSIEGDLKKLVRSIEKIGTARQALLSPDMRWAHFGQPKPQPAGLHANIQTLTSPTTLPMLKESAHEFLRKARDFVGQ